MNKPALQQQDGLLECEICLKEIPTSEAMNDEVSDYVMHFCGLECYARWKQQKESQQD